MVTGAPVTVAKPATERATATLIVPTRDRADLLAACLAGLEKTRPQDFDLVIVDNGSREPATRDRLDRFTVTHEVSAVTGACLAVEKEKFDAIGGSTRSDFRSSSATSIFVCG